METLALYAIKGGDGGGGSGSGDVTGVKGSAESTYRKGNVSISAANIGLGNVNNTADADKPISTATQTALDGKVDKVIGKGLSTNDYDATAKDKLDALVDIQSIGTGLSLNTTTHELTATGISITIDDEMSSTSVNPVQNKVITAALGDKISKSATAGLVKNDGTIDTDVKQNQTLSSAITIDEVNYTSVETALGALSNAVGAMTDAQWTQVQAILN